MASITITSTTNSIKVDFGVYSTSLERSKGVWRKEIVRFGLATNFIEVSIKGEKVWSVSHDGNSLTTPTFQIDTVDSLTPSSLSDLYDKLEDLIA